MDYTYEERLDDMVTALQSQRDELFRLLGPMPVHDQRTHQMDSALKGLDVSIGLLSAVRAAWMNAR